MLTLTSLMVVVNLPGEPDWERTYEPLFYYCRHGWPRPYLEREYPSDFDDFPSPPTFAQRIGLHF